MLARHDLVHPDGRQFHVYGSPGGALAGALAGQPGAADDRGEHLRFDLATATWVAVSPARNTRPAGHQPPVACPLCPGGLELPFPYEAAVFDNRFPALSPWAPEAHGPGTARAAGRCQVVVYTPEHEGSLATLPPAQVARVVGVWRDRTTALWAEGHQCVMAFENRGAAIGATLTHPHGQLYALGFVPPFVRAKVDAAERHRAATGGCVGCALVASDDRGERVVVPSDQLVVAVPFAARWPFEVHVRARRHGCRRLADLTGAEARELAKVLREVTGRFDGLFGFELPAMTMVHEAPGGCDDWHLHVELVPLHRSADQLKVRASVETGLGLFVNDTLPERSAEQLRAADVAPADWSGVQVPVVEAG